MPNRERRKSVFHIMLAGFGKPKSIGERAIVENLKIHAIILVLHKLRIPIGLLRATAQPDHISLAILKNSFDVLIIRIGENLCVGVHAHHQFFENGDEFVLGAKKIKVIHFDVVEHQNLRTIMKKFRIAIKKR